MSTKLIRMFGENISFLKEEAKFRYKREIARNLISLLEDPSTWEVADDLTHREILRITVEAYNSFHPNLPEWCDEPLDVLVSDAYRYAVSTIRHQFTYYDDVLGEIREIIGGGYIPKEIKNKVQGSINIMVKLTYPELYEYLEAKYFQDNQ